MNLLINKENNEIIGKDIPFELTIEADKGESDGRYLNRNGIYYIAHPLTSFGSMEENYTSEEEFSEKVKGLGFKNLVRPLEVIPKEYSSEDALRVCMSLLPICDGIILQGGWSKSDGCRKELSVAKAIGLKVCVPVFVNGAMQIAMVRKK